MPNSDPVTENDPKDTGYSPEHWEFDDEVTRVFDDMLQRSIPQYEVMRQAVLDVADHFAKPETYVVDLGSARGEAVARLIDRRGAQLKYSLCESSPPMVEALKKRFAHWTDQGLARIRSLDLRSGHPPEVCSVTMAVLTLQFVPIEYRQGIVANVFKKLEPGGAFILVEKVLGDTSSLDALMVGLYLKQKREQGYTQDEIDRKRLALEGRLVPITGAWNEDLLHKAGFSQVDCFWRWHNFAAWVAVK